jgi:hypothetical protein
LLFALHSPFSCPRPYSRCRTHKRHQSCQRLPHRYRVVRMARPCVRRLLETAGRSRMCLCTAHWPLLHTCLERSFHGADHSEAPSGTREEHPRHLVGCHPHCVPAPPFSGLARPAVVSLRRPRSAVENVEDLAHLRGSRCGPPGSQMHTLAQKYYGKTVSTQSKTRAIVHIGLLFLFRALLSSLLPWGFWAR